MKKNKISNKDYFYLAKNSLKSRKKSTRTTVRGIAFGLILILPVLFFTFAYYIDFNAKINEIESVSILNIETESKEAIEPTRTVNGWELIASNSLIKDIDNEIPYTERVVYESYSLINYNLTASVNNGPVTNINDMQSDTHSNNIQISPYNREPSRFLDKISFLHYKDSMGKLTTDSIMSDLNLNQPIISGNNFTPETRGKGEILLTEGLAQNYRLKVGDKISFYLNDSKYSNPELIIDNDNIVGNEYIAPEEYKPMTKKLTIFRDYTVVGLINSKIYSHERNYRLASFIMTDASLYDDNGNKFAPTLRDASITENGHNQKRHIATYTEDIAEVNANAISNGCVALALGHAFSFAGSGSGQVMLYQTQYASYGECTKVLKCIDKSLKNLNVDSSANNLGCTSYTYDSLAIINQISIIIIGVFLVFGGVILFATLINLYNSIQYSVEARKNYMGMLRAIGTKDSSIYRMYFTEILLIFLKALPWILIIGGGISIGIKFGLDRLFSYTEDFFPIALTLNLWYLPLVLGGIFLFSLGIAWIYSKISCRTLAKKPILGLLKEDR